MDFSFYPDDLNFSSVEQLPDFYTNGLDVLL